MQELRAILETWRALGAARADAVLASVVHVAGSAYRRPGARMLLLPRGRRIGAISGGCLEAEIVRKAWWLTESRRPVVRAYDTSADDDGVFEFGLGCNGVVHVLLERTDGARVAEWLDFVEDGQRRAQATVVATVIGAPAASDHQAGDRLLVDDRGVHGGALRGSCVGDALLAHVHRALEHERSHLAHVDGHAVFIEHLAPAQELVVFGAGDDARPLVTMAAALGWRITVADGRPAHATPERFPGAASVVRMTPEDLLAGVRIGPRTAVVVMTHNFPLDTQLVPLVLQARPRYLGLLGPITRAERLFATLGRSLPAWVHAPVGLDLGGDTPAAVALAILSEVQATVAGRSGQSLRLRDTPIHAPVEEIGERATAAAPVERPVVCEIAQDTHAA